VLGQFVREEALLSVEEAVRSMTSAAAERLGLRDRGLTSRRPCGGRVVFDPVRVRSNATYDDPRRYPDGIEWVLVGATSSSSRASDIPAQGLDESSDAADNRASLGTNRAHALHDERGGVGPCPPHPSTLCSH
jgi:hypothetical protein